MLDFNDALPQEAEPVHIIDHAERDEIHAELIARLESVLRMQFPAGKVSKDKFFIGDVLGSPGRSLEAVLTGEKAGLWTDRASGDGGDIFDLIAGGLALNAQTDFPRVLQAVRDLIGRAPVESMRKSRKQVPVDDLGPATAKWDYQDADGNLISVVYRYDPPGGKKEFRPWDAKRKKMAPPEPRPLYNQPGFSATDSVVLVEGEKCAQALIDVGICATTAMHGANAPVEKTDWSPLAGKSVLIWPDKDKPGWAYAEAASQAILAAGATSCNILFPPDDKPEGWDAADALAEGFEVSTFLSTGPSMTVHAMEDLKPTGSDPHPADEQTVWGTDDALALSFTRRYHRDWRYIAAWGKWLMWDGQRWRSEETLAASHLIRQVCRQASVQADNPKIAAKLAGASTVGGVERLAKSDRKHAATADEWDANIWLLNTPGGVVDLRTGRMRPHERADRMTKIATATPRGSCPRWLAFLSDVTGGDSDLQSYLQRMIGYCLTGSTAAHALFFLYGTGANGKSVFTNVIATILGDYATTSPMDTFVETRGDRHPTDLAGLRGARFVTAIETEQGRRWAESKVKAITGGDMVSARFMRQDFFSYLPQFKPVIVGNHKPSIRNIDEAMRRRLHLIPFTVTIPPDRRDGQLTDKLLAERDGILAWALEGCLAWQREGLKPPKVVVDATDEYFDEEDAVGEFIEEECQRHPQVRVSVADVFQRWQEWANRRGEHIGTSRWLMQQLCNRRFERTRLHGGVKGVAGLSLKPKDYGDRLPYRDD